MFKLSFTRRTLLQTSLVAPFVLATRRAQAATADIKFSLAAPFDGSNAAYFLGEQNGWFRDAGLNCQFDISGGSGEAVTRVGSGVYDAGVADINVMAEFDAKNPDSAIRDVYMLYYRSPLCVCSLAKSGITKPSDLAGRKFGAAAPDGAYRLFPAYAQTVGVDTSKISWDMVGLQLREAVLARGDVEAILGFDSTMYFGLLKAGIDAKDIRFLYYSDAGLDLYGNGIMISNKFAAGDPSVIKRFVEATARSWQAAIANPDAAIAALQKHAPLINAKLETDKLHWLIKNQLVTAESRADGLGGVRPDRMAKALEIVGKTLAFPKNLGLADVFDPAYLPSASYRNVSL
jgi:NitT/TauT family transport system substrate-binding protein